jgi:hypothetical protein
MPIRIPMEGAPVLNLAFLTLVTPSQASDLHWSGHYRARGQLFQSLSLSETNPQAEGLSGATTHRLRLQPSWIVHDSLSIHTQLDLLPYAMWGDEPSQVQDPTYSDSAFFSQNVAPPSVEGQNLQATRVWAQYDTGYGVLRFGRMPHHWGAGMVYNAGNRPLDEFGDSVDRIQYTAKVEQMFFLAALDSYRENYANDFDDTWGAATGFMYNTEKASSGLYATYRRQNVDDAAFGMLTLDLHGKAQAGPLATELEFAFQYGKGDLEGGLNDIALSAVGAALTTELALDKLFVGLDLGMAQGDPEPEDKEFHSFRFDPDYSIGLMMFEEPMPTLGAASKSSSNLGREYGASRTGYSVSNALYARPSVGATLLPGLRGDLYVLAARAFVLSEDEGENKGYGAEIDARLRWSPVAKFQIDGTFGVFFPGAYYSSYSHEELGGGFSQHALGAQLLGTAEF